MIPFPEVKITEKTKQYHIMERFLTTPYWDTENRDLFAPDVEVEFPFAPPGMIQQMRPFEFLPIVSGCGRL